MKLNHSMKLKILGAKYIDALRNGKDASYFRLMYNKAYKEMKEDYFNGKTTM